MVEREPTVIITATKYSIRIRVNSESIGMEATIHVDHGDDEALLKRVKEAINGRVIGEGWELRDPE